MHGGNRGEKVRQLQNKLVYMGYLTAEDVDGTYGSRTADAVRAFQADHGLPAGGIANIATQLALDDAVSLKTDLDPDTWRVVDDEDG